jgi:hypothetical protein
MCDFSLEAFKSEKADVGVSYELKRTVSGSKGFFKTYNSLNYAESCAACVTEGSVLRIEIPEAMQYENGVTAIEDVIFTQKKQSEGYGYRDGVRLENGKQYLLQDFPEGTRATVLMLADTAAPEDKAVASDAPPAAAPMFYGEYAG